MPRNQEVSWTLGCNNKNFHSKLEAIKEHNLSKQAITFDIPNEYYNYDCVEEPKESLQELCVKEAKHIREKYDKVNLFYSGGCDSHYILQTFLDNNIKLDKMIIVKSGFDKADFEIDQFALPFAKKTNIPIEVRCPDMNYYKKIYENKFVSRTQHDQWFHFRLNNDFENVKDTPDNEVNLFGKDKPKLINVENNWYTYFLDVDVTPQPKQYNFYLENPTIHFKQCHMLMRNIIQHKSQEQYNTITFFDEHQDFWNKSIGRYDVCNFPMKLLQHEGYYNNKDQLAVAQAPLEIVKLWRERNKALVEQYGDAWFNRGDPSLGTVGVFSKFMCLTKKDTKNVDQLFPNGFLS